MLVLIHLLLCYTMLPLHICGVSQVLKLLKREIGKNGNFKMIVGKTSFTRNDVCPESHDVPDREFLRYSAWRNRNFFPKFNNSGAE